MAAKPRSEPVSRPLLRRLALKNARVARGPWLPAIMDVTGLEMAIWWRLGRWQPS